MSQVKLGICVLLIALLCIPSLLMFAGDEDDRARKAEARRDRDDVRPKKENERDQDREDDDDDEDEIIALGKTVKLTFSIVGEEEERSFFVLCAANHYGIKHDVSEPNFNHGLEIEGRLHAVDAKDRLFITYEASINHSDNNEGIEASFSVEGSALLKLGKKTTLAVLGDEPLTVTATVED